MGRYIGSSVELQGMKLVIGPIQREARGATGDETSGWADEQGRRPVNRLAHLWSKPGAKYSGSSVELQGMRRVVRPMSRAVGPSQG